MYIYTYDLKIKGHSDILRTRLYNIIAFDIRALTYTLYNLDVSTFVNNGITLRLLGWYLSDIMLF